ncbi:hypothetical protein NIES22_26150 [Calothrix brevissima NIES-22]|nr:hypothetical protein NIES22_26150 [Calothrix brevissima NIES-22]
MMKFKESLVLHKVRALYSHAYGKYSCNLAGEVKNLDTAFTV